MTHRTSRQVAAMSFWARGDVLRHLSCSVKYPTSGLGMAFAEYVHLDDPPDLRDTEAMSATSDSQRSVDPESMIQGDVSQPFG